MADEGSPHHATSRSVENPCASAGDVAKAPAEGGELAPTRQDRGEAVHRPRLLTDNGASQIAGDLAEWLAGRRVQIK
jgi:hypothetical protein